MIRLLDASILAYTKLRVHRVRTGIAIIVAALLFGLIGGAIIVAQGIFTSVESFSDEGLNKRTIVTVNKSGSTDMYNIYDKLDKPDVVQGVEAEYNSIVAIKKAAAKKYSVSYNPQIDDPSPIVVDSKSKQRVVSESALQSESVQQFVRKKQADLYKPFKIEPFLSKYSSASLIQEASSLNPLGGSLGFMKNGEESMLTNEQERFMAQMSSEDRPELTILDSSLSTPFVAPGKFNATSGDIPAIIPFSDAEKNLGLKPLDDSVSTSKRLERLAYVRENIDKVAVSFCYRNDASQVLLSKAINQAEEMRLNESVKDYQKPKLQYALPSKKDCGAVTIKSDTRTATEKKQDENRLLYDKEIGNDPGEPVQKMITIRGVGVSSDVPMTQAWSLSSLVQGLFGSWLGYRTWNIPSDLLAQIPADARPDYIFKQHDPDPKTAKRIDYAFAQKSYLVEFTDKDQARDAMSSEKTIGGEKMFAYPYGSGVLFVDEAKRMLIEVIKWALLVVGGIAIIILASIIGRTVSEGRRESAIFRAIGASRGDISAVYGVYVLYLAALVVLFSAVFACAAALTVQLLYGAEATLGARLAYAASDTTRQFYLFDFSSPYLLWIIGAIFAASIVASIIPILLGARRNPINDMRNE